MAVQLFEEGGTHKVERKRTFGGEKSHLCAELG